MNKTRWGGYSFFTSYLQPGITLLSQAGAQTKIESNSSQGKNHVSMKIKIWQNDSIFLT